MRNETEAVKSSLSSRLARHLPLLLFVLLVVALASLDRRPITGTSKHVAIVGLTVSFFIAISFLFARERVTRLASNVVGDFKAVFHAISHELPLKAKLFLGLLALASIVPLLVGAATFLIFGFPAFQLFQYAETAGAVNTPLRRSIAIVCISFSLLLFVLGATYALFAFGSAWLEVIERTAALFAR